MALLAFILGSVSEMVKTLTILFVLLITSVVQAQALVIRVTETECTPTGCRQLIGTGACAYVGDIDERSVYITAAHNINNAKTIHVGYDGRWWGAVVKYREYSGSADYAIIETVRIPANTCFEVSNRIPQDGSAATAYGYSQGIYNLRSLKARIRIRNGGGYFTKIVEKGDSGGPILVNGQVVGIIKGHDYRETIYTDSVRIRRKLISVYGRIPCCGCGTPAVADQGESKPDPDPSSGDLTALQDEVTRLKAEIDKLNKTQIPVWIVGADGEPVAKQTYPLGDPIKLRFKAVKQSEAK
ncbi:hypothetical protein [Gimesia sp.]|uniref:hypothetical protein n=1 Tax=Gimesia sp. TaxID=2024833 RepID=UPI003A8E8ED2